jgi:signal transduction histidine kinase
MELRRRSVIPLIPLTTLLLAVVLAVLVGGLFVVVDRLLESQVRQALVAETREWANALSASTGKLLWNLDDSAVQVLGEASARNPIVLSLQIQNDRNQTLFRKVRPGLPLETVRIPVRYEGMFAGTIELSSDGSLVRSRVEALELPASLAVAVFLILVVVVTPLVLSRTVLRPILKLGRLVQTMDPVSLPDEDLATGSRIQEVSALGGAIRSLASAVRDNVHTLEARVNDRTSALNRARAQLAHAEALATLGGLTAGIAHELNTPLAAILSANRTLSSELLDHQCHLLAAGWDPQFSSEPEALLREASALAQTLDSHRMSAARAQLKAAFLAGGHDPASELFELLAKESLLPLGLRVAAWPPGSREEDSLATVLLSSRLLRVVEVAAEKGAAVVQALRGQLRHDEHEPAVWFDVAASLERCLLLHQGHLGTTVEIRRRCEPGLKVYGPEARLGQVWLNLINNALQSVGSRGWIEVGARSDHGGFEVRVGDSGPAVPDELRSRLFEPYFTTKPTGLGLGLHLSRSVVEALGGQLTYEGSPGVKAFVARWPQPPTVSEDVESRVGSDLPS